MNTRLSVRFAPISYFNILFSICIHCITKTKKIADFIKKKIVDFHNLRKIEFCWRTIFGIWARSVQAF